VFLDTTREDSLIFVANHEQSHGADHLMFEEIQRFSLPQWLDILQEGWQEFGNQQT
jgi:hypothetical protein